MLRKCQTKVNILLIFFIAVADATAHHSGIMQQLQQEEEEEEEEEEENDDDGDGDEQKDVNGKINTRTSCYLYSHAEHVEKCLIDEFRTGESNQTFRFTEINYINTSWLKHAISS